MSNLTLLANNRISRTRQSPFSAKRKYVATRYMTRLPKATNEIPALTIPMPVAYSSWFNAFDVDKLNLVTGANIDLIEDLETSTPYDLTQTTSGDQAELAEHDTVTQFTSASKPTLIDLGGGVLGMHFASGDMMEFRETITLSENFKIETTLDFAADSTPKRLISDAPNESSLRISNFNTVNLVATGSDFYSFTSSPLSGDEKIELVCTNGILSLELDGVPSPDTFDTTGKVFTFSDLSSAFQPFMGSIISLKIWIGTSSGDPNLDLIASEESCNALIGQQASRWQSSTHRDFKNRFDFGTDDFYNGFPVLAGDATYVINNFTFKVLATMKYFLSHSTGPAKFGVNATDKFQAIADDGTVFAFSTSSVNLSESTAALKHEGDTLSLYLKGVLIESLDVTGKTFSFNRLGDEDNSINASLGEVLPYNFALSLDKIKYFSYRRDEDTNEIVEPPTLIA